MCFIVTHVENYLLKKCLNHLKKNMHNRHKQKREKQVIDHSTGLDPVYTGLVTTVQALYLLETCCLGWVFIISYDEV